MNSCMNLSWLSNTCASRRPLGLAVQTTLEPIFGPKAGGRGWKYRNTSMTLATLAQVLQFLGSNWSGNIPHCGLPSHRELFFGKPVSYGRQVFINGRAPILPSLLQALLTSRVP